MLAWGVYMKTTLSSLNKIVSSFDRAIAYKTLLSSSPGVGLRNFASKEVANCLTTKRALTCLGPLLLRHQRVDQTLPVTSARRNCLIQGKTFHYVEFAIHAFYDFFGAKVFQRVLLEVETISDDRFKLSPRVLRGRTDALQQASLQPFLTRFWTWVAALAATGVPHMATKLDYWLSGVGKRRIVRARTMATLAPMKCALLLSDRANHKPHRQLLLNFAGCVGSFHMTRSAKGGAGDSQGFSHCRAYARLAIGGASLELAQQPCRVSHHPGCAWHVTALCNVCSAQQIKTQRPSHTFNGLYCPLGCSI